MKGQLHDRPGGDEGQVGRVAGSNALRNVTSRVNLRGAKLEQDLRLEGVSLYKADVRYSTMEEVMFTRCNMVGAKLERSELQGATFDQCAMMTVQLKASNMRRARLKDSILIGASFDNAVLSDAVIVGGVWMNTQFNGTDVKDALFVEPAGLDPKEARSLKKKWRSNVRYARAVRCDEQGRRLIKRFRSDTKRKTLCEL